MSRPGDARGAYGRGGVLRFERSEHGATSPPWCNESACGVQNSRLRKHDPYRASTREPGQVDSHALWGRQISDPTCRSACFGNRAPNLTPRSLIIWKLSDKAVAGARKLGHSNPQTQEFTINLK